MRCSRCSKGLSSAQSNWIWVLCLVSLLACFPALAEAPVDSDAVVDIVQMPAWVERGGRREPLAPGKALQNRDKVFTGRDARVLIQLADGSTVKLGENAELHLNLLGRRADSGLAGALEIVRGAFRLTPGKTPGQSVFNVRIATITAGTRNADLWGSAHAEGDLVCSLEGQVMVLHEREESRYLSEPLSCYFAAKGAAPRLIDDVDRSKVRLCVEQTEIQPGRGFVQRGGLWGAHLMTLESEDRALRLYDQARAAGYAASIQPTRVKRKVYQYTVSVAQAPTRDEAEALAARLRSTL